MQKNLTATEVEQRQKEWTENFWRLLEEQLTEPALNKILEIIERKKMSEFHKELEQLINKHSMENISDTPDFILADYMMGCLKNFDTSVRIRDDWYGFKGLSRKEED